MEHYLGWATLWLLVWEMPHQIHLARDVRIQAYLVMAHAIDRVAPL
jgi:hypothetical protein